MSRTTAPADGNDSALPLVVPDVDTNETSNAPGPVAKSDEQWRQELTAEEFAGSDLSYAPPFSPTYDPVLVAARVASRVEQG